MSMLCWMEQIYILGILEYLVAVATKVISSVIVYLQALERTMLVFEDLLTRLKLSVLSEKDRIDCDWLLARSEALMLKSK